MKMPLALLALLVLSIAGCRGCGREPAEPPIHFIAADAEAVVEIRDVRLLVRAREALARDYGAILTPADVDSLRQELTLTLGFDPSSDEGLTKAGLRAEGSIAIQISGGGRSALWALPIADAKAFGQTVQNAASARIGVSAVSVETTPHGPVTVLISKFGRDDVVVAAYATAKGVGLVGAGGAGRDLVTAALARKPEQSIASQPEYGKQVGALGADWEARIISATGSRAFTSALDIVKERVDVRLIAGHPLLAMVKSSGLALDASKGSVRLKGTLRLDEQGLERSKQLFSVAPSSKGVRAVDVRDAALILEVAAEPKALVDGMAPKGTPHREALDGFFARVKQDASTDLEAEVMPLLTGEAAVAFGVGDLSVIPFRLLSQNPMAALWTAIAVGVKDEAAIAAIEKRLDPGLAARSLQITTRNAAGKEVRNVGAPSPNGANVTLVESFTRDGALVFSNEPLMTNAIVVNEGRDLLGGKPGLAVEVRFGVLARQLETFPVGSLPPIFRLFAKKIIDAVRLLDGASLIVRPDAGGIGIAGELRLSSQAP